MKVTRRLRVVCTGVCAAAALSACGVEKVEVVRIPMPERAARLSQVTDEFGPLVVREGEFEVESERRPWSAWWYPIRDTYLFESGERGRSPLEKYDHYASFYHDRPGADAGAAWFEKENVWDPNANPWEGHCNAWAAASIAEEEPVAGAKINGLEFGIGDLKALLVKSYEDVPGLKSYGQRNNGDRKGIYDDIYPDQFHKLIQTELFERGRPFIMDKDPGLPVWNTPVWKAQVRIERDPADAGVVHATSWIFGASPFVDSYDYVGTLSVAFEYTYDLFGNFDAEGGFHVTRGEWTGKSLDYHPDFVTTVPDRPEHRSINALIDSSIVDEIVKKARSARH